MGSVISIQQTVSHYAVDGFSVAGLSSTFFRWIEKVGCPGHVFRAPSDDDFRISTTDGLGGGNNGSEAGPADLVHSRGGHREWDASTDGDLSCDILAQTGTDHVSDEHFVDILCRAGARGQDGSDDGRCYIRGGTISEGVAETSNGRPMRM